MRTDENLFFVTADMGINLVEKIQEAYPDRYLNAGIAEQNAIGVCAGLCNLGYRPFVYTISNFLIHRCFEQIRNDIAIHRYPVTLLGSSAGYDNPPLGPTHHILDEWGALRTIPGFTIYSPSSVRYSLALVDKILAQNNPVYVRIPKGSFEHPDSDEDYVYIEAPSPEILLLTYGSLAQTGLKLQSRLSNLSLLVCNRLFPIDERRVADILARYDKVIVLEDHFPSSGMYSLLCEFCMTQRIQTRLFRCAPREQYILEAGSSSEYYHRLFKMDETGVLETIQQIS